MCSVDCAGVGERSAGAPGYWAGSRLGSPTADWSAAGSKMKKKMNTRLSQGEAFLDQKEELHFNM